MALPDRNTPWPPPELQTAYQAYEAWSAWYTGDTDALQMLYATSRLQKASGVWPTVKRFFWGTPVPGEATQRPVKLHVPVPAEIARMSAALLFADLPTFQFGDGDGDADDKGLPTTVAKNVNARLADLIDDRAHAALLEAAEVQAGLGGSFVAVTWDKQAVPDGPFLRTLPPDAAIPTFRWGRLVSVIFWSDLPPVAGSSGVWRLLEEHTPGRVEWAVYRADTKATIGTRMALADHPDTEELATLVDDGEGTVTGTDLLTAVYVPNRKPNRAWRKDPVACNLGRSDFDQLEPVFDSLDETYTSWMRDIRLGKARILASRELLDVRDAGNGAAFDLDREIFSPLAAAPGSLNPNAKAGAAAGLIDQVQFAIRVQEHKDSAEHFLEVAVRAAGYSVQTFGESADIATTATEINSREKLSILTRGAKILHWRPELQHIVAVLLDVDAHVFGGPGRGKALPDVEFADAAAEAPQVLAQTLQLLNTAESASIKTRVGMLHPDWDDEQIAAEVDAIRADYSELPDPTMAHLWAAQSLNSSATGGVKIGNNGTPPVPVSVPPAETQAVDDTRQ